MVLTRDRFGARARGGRAGATASATTEGLIAVGIMVGAAGRDGAGRGRAGEDHTFARSTGLRRFIDLPRLHSHG